MRHSVHRSGSVASEDGSSASSSSEGSEAPVELLVTSRAKRITAGSRINSLIQKEKDELVDLVFEKEEGDVDSEEDIDFVDDGDDGGSEARLDSSTDDEDQGPDKANDDLEGEKELQNQIRAERQKKRKAHVVFQSPTVGRKKVKVDPIATTAAKMPTTPASRSKKKPERVSWIPTSEEGPVRASSRKQTMQNKETVHLRMAEKEKQRIKQMKHMEEAEKKRQAAKVPPMTQAQRMAEAARIERKNAKSLNRWQEAEKEKAEALKAKLEALHSRQLGGPVISWWSGLARWVNGKLCRVGAQEVKDLKESEELIPHTRPNKRSTELLSSKPSSEIEAGSALSTNHITRAQPSCLAPPLSDPVRAVHPVSKVTFAPPLGPGGFLEGIHYYASLPSQPGQTALTATVRPLPPDTHRGAATSPLQLPEPESPIPIDHPAAFVENPTRVFHPANMPPRPGAQRKQLSIEYSTRNLVTLRNIDSNSVGRPELQSCLLLKKRSNKLPSQYLVTDASRECLLMNE